MAPLDPALVETLRFTNASQVARIDFVNQRGSAVDICWIDYEGKRVLYHANFAPVLSWQAGTFLTHPWLVVASGSSGTTEQVPVSGSWDSPADGDTALITSAPATGVAPRRSRRRHRLPRAILRRARPGSFFRPSMPP